MLLHVEMTCHYHSIYLTSTEHHREKSQR